MGVRNRVGIFWFRVGGWDHGMGFSWENWDGPGDLIGFNGGRKVETAWVLPGFGHVVKY